MASVAADEHRSEHVTVVSLPAAKAKRFLNRLAEHPFLCVVLTPEGPVFYEKGMDADNLRIISEAIEAELTGE